MTIGSLLLGLALFALVALYVLRPVLAPQKTSREARVSVHEELSTQKEAILAQIRSLDLDFETGKLPEREYQKIREAYITEAALVLKEMDGLEKAREQLRPRSVTASKQDLDNEIEAALARLKPRLITEEDTGSEAHKAEGSANGKGLVCSSCGEVLDPEDKFCGRCGQKINQSQPA